ncbi:MAG: PRC-barrel domain-containing protein [Solirubrobacteraceae bacterium]
MNNIEQISDWRGQDVLDSGGEKIGKVDEVFHSAGGGEAAFVAVKSGLLGRRSHLVPLAEATFARDYIRVAFTQQQVEQADGAPEGTLDPPTADRVSALYGMEPRGVAYESASLIDSRRVEAEEAQRRADELEERAQEQVSQVEAARRDADDAAVRADQVERDGHRAREDAESARAEADTLAARRREQP